MKVRPIKFNPKKFAKPETNFTRCNHIPDFRTVKPRDLRFNKWFEVLDDPDKKTIYICLCNTCAASKVKQTIHGYDANGSPVTE